MSHMHIQNFQNVSYAYSEFSKCLCIFRIFKISHMHIQNYKMSLMHIQNFQNAKIQTIMCICVLDNAAPIKLVKILNVM